MAGGRDGCCGWGGDADKLGDGVVGEVGEPDVAGGVDGQSARVAEAGGLVAGGGRDRGAGVCESGEGVAVAVGDPDAVAAVDGDLRWSFESASGVAAGGRDEVAVLVGFADGVVLVAYVPDVVGGVDRERGELVVCGGGGYGLGHGDEVGGEAEAVETARLADGPGGAGAVDGDAGVEGAGGEFFDEGAVGLKDGRLV